MQIEVIKFRDILPVRNVSGFVQGTSQPTLIGVGTDFSKADKVFINHIECPSFQVVNKTTIHAVVPAGQEGDLRSIAIVSYEFNRMTERSIIEYEIGNHPRLLKGIL